MTNINKLLSVVGEADASASAARQNLAGELGALVGKNVSIFGQPHSRVITRETQPNGAVNRVSMPYIARPGREPQAVTLRLEGTLLHADESFVEVAAPQPSETDPIAPCAHMFWIGDIVSLEEASLVNQTA